jgi:hypothetical protein
MDSVPGAVGDNDRIPPAPIDHQEAYRGEIASQKRYVYGLTIHLLVTPHGHPVEDLLTPGPSSDVRASRSLPVDVPAGCVIDAEKAYHDYGMEDLRYESVQIELSPIRKEYSNRALPPYGAFAQDYYRHRIETAARVIARRWPNTIQAVTARGFAWKVFLVVLASSIDCL